jgi:hypothetical protein
VDERKTLGLTALVMVLDILSDIMSTSYLVSRTNKSYAHIVLVVSIPIIVLRSTLLGRSTKFGLAVFLCLSVFMAICAIIRIAGFHYKGQEDDIWEFFWQQTEGAVAVMMASITAFRTLFVRQASDSEGTPPCSPVESLLHRVFSRFQALARAQPAEKSTSAQPDSILKLPKVPSPIFTGMRSFIRGNNQTNVSAASPVSLPSVTDGSEADYHEALKTQSHAASGNSSSYGQC